MSDDSKGAGGLGVGVGILAALKVCSHSAGDAPQLTRALSHQTGAEARVVRALEKPVEEALPALTRSLDQPSVSEVFEHASKRPMPEQRRPRESLGWTDPAKDALANGVSDVVEAWRERDGGS